MKEEGLEEVLEALQSLLDALEGLTWGFQRYRSWRR